MYSNALVIGKFNNLHKGHIALIHYAKSLAEKVTVLICSEEDDPIDLDLRIKWLREECAYINIAVARPSVLGLSNSSVSDKQVSKEWATWIHGNLPEIDVCVGSEQYINYMADCGYFEGVIYDEFRMIDSCSSTSVREGDFENYCFAAKKDLVKVVAFIGPESCGKTTLAEHLSTVDDYYVVPELARFTFSNSTHYSTHELEEVALATQSELAFHIKKATTPWIIMDSSTLTTLVYFGATFQKPNSLINSLFTNEPVDHYILFTPETEFVQDGTRTQTQFDREVWFKTAKHYLDSLQKPYTVISGSDWDQRQKDVENVLATL